MQPNENNKLIGRAEEKGVLHRLYSSKSPEFLAVYGRRRVGKTFLIRKYFEGKGFYFEHTGLRDGNLSQQLQVFSDNFSRAFFPGLCLQRPRSWNEALGQLTEQVEAMAKRKKVIIFFDELPWMSTPRSGLIQALDFYWNQRWSRMPNIKFIVCGSAASWMLDNLVHAKGGLHNRLTQRILLEPFKLRETHEFLASRKVKLSQKQVLELYLSIGGIPHYLNQIQAGKSAAQNIDSLCFRKNGMLVDEFPRLFKSLFSHSEVCEKIVRILAKSRYGVGRDELLKKTGIGSGGTFNKRLSELEAAGFIQGFVPYGNKRKSKAYRVCDEYTLFYLKWIEPTRRSGLSSNRGYWQSKSKSSSFQAWAGYAFEGVCYKHIDEIRGALGLRDIPCEIGTWRVSGRTNRGGGAQIDLLFDRDDGVVTLAEIKYSINKFTIDKAYAKILANKQTKFEEQLGGRKDIFMAMVTTMGVKENFYSEDLISDQMDLTAFF